MLGDGKARAKEMGSGEFRTEVGRCAIGIEEGDCEKVAGVALTVRLAMRLTVSKG